MLQNAIKNVRKAREGDGGFTLIELLIVIIVLGILAGIVVFGVGTFRQDATDSAKATNCKVVSTAAEAYNAKTGGYPATVGALQTAGYIKDIPGSMTAATTITATGTATGC
jgi:prepilin-type N-terminal cleavage/methylation domain-containing protein